MIRVLAVIVASMCLVPALAAQRHVMRANVTASVSTPEKDNTLLIDTTKGQVVIKLRPDLAPQNVERIKQLVHDGFYDNLPFHRVVEGFVAQTGDGQYFNGTGASKYPNVPAEFSNVPFKRGIVGMSRIKNENNSGNSQFFITLKQTDGLNGQYTVVGEVVAGMNVVDKFAPGEPPDKPDMVLTVRLASDAK
jgi:peptidylprolyl isomerase